MTSERLDAEVDILDAGPGPTLSRFEQGHLGVRIRGQVSSLDPAESCENESLHAINQVLT